MSGKENAPRIRTIKITFQGEHMMTIGKCRICGTMMKNRTVVCEPCETRKMPVYFG